jgi:Domain of unknown function (DUF4281)
MPAWLLLWFFPRWKFTDTLVKMSALAESAVYVATIASLMMKIANDSYPPPDFFSLDGVQAAFAERSMCFLGWVHYIAFDLMVGRCIVRDANERNVSMIFHIFVVGPCLFFTLMLGPTGYLMYEAIAYVFLPVSPEKAKMA